MYVWFVKRKAWQKTIVLYDVVITKYVRRTRVPLLYTFVPAWYCTRYTRLTQVVGPIRTTYMIQRTRRASHHNSFIINTINTIYYYIYVRRIVSYIFVGSAWHQQVRSDQQSNKDQNPLEPVNAEKSQHSSWVTIPTDTLLYVYTSEFRQISTLLYVVSE